MARVLYIEDDPHVRHLVMTLLTRSGHECLTAADGETGLLLARQHQPALILLDINMPLMDGFETHRRLKADPALQPIPVIALTANVMHGDRQQLLDQGFDGYLAKPITRLVLNNVINHWLKHSQER